jgi:hypothetical protein
MDAREAFVALNLIEHVGPVRVRQLLDFFGDAPAVLGATKRQLLQVQGTCNTGQVIGDNLVLWKFPSRLCQHLKSLLPAPEFLEGAADVNVAFRLVRRLGHEGLRQFERGWPLFHFGADLPTGLQHIGVRPTRQGHTVEFLRGFREGVKLAPPLGGIDVTAVGWIKLLHWK